MLSFPSYNVAAPLIHRAFRFALTSPRITLYVPASYICLSVAMARPQTGHLQIASTDKQRLLTS
jgi:hypothetical protein